MVEESVKTLYWKLTMRYSSLVDRIIDAEFDCDGRLDAVRGAIEELGTALGYVED